MAGERDLLEVLTGFVNEDRETLVPARLSILVYLYFANRSQFSQLKSKLDLTSGNLASHLKKLENMGLIKTTRHFIELKPARIVEITPKGVQKVRQQILRMRDLVTRLIDQEPSTDV